MFCKKHLTNRHASSFDGVMDHSPTFGMPSSPFNGVQRKRAPSFSDPGPLPPRSPTGFPPYGGDLPKFDEISISRPGFQDFGAPQPMRARTFSRLSTWPQAMTSLPPLPMSTGLPPLSPLGGSRSRRSSLRDSDLGPPQAFRDMLFGGGLYGSTGSTSRPPSRPYY